MRTPRLDIGVRNALINNKEFFMANKKSVYFIQLEYNNNSEKEEFEKWLYDILYRINLKTIYRDIIVDCVKFYECRNVTIYNK